jgi:hypothetical protein
LGQKVYKYSKINKFKEDKTMKNYKEIKVWVSEDKKMIAFYTDKACIDLFLEKKDINLSGGKVKLEFYEGDRLVKEKICGPGDIISIDEILSFLSEFT